jgi:tetratricopeptide (TPR) repeat protein
MKLQKRKVSASDPMIFKRINMTTAQQKFIVFLILAVCVVAVYCRVGHFDFVNFDDAVYVTENSHVQAGLTAEGFRWAFSTTHAQFWHPLTWLSLMFDGRLYGLTAGGYHFTSLILHTLSTLLLFLLFCRMTGEIWKSGFVAALFALHPLQVESVVWVSQRKDVLSGFFWMLTLCLYVYYTEKPVLRRYWPVLLCFLCGLMSKPMVVTLPVMMILLDYWPLKRFASRKSNGWLWQVREKAPFFVLSAVFSIITIYAQTLGYSPAGFRLKTSLMAFFVYLQKIVWPDSLAVFYPLPDIFPVLQLWGLAVLGVLITAGALVLVRRFPPLLVGWLWFVIALLPVIGLVRSGFFFVADHYVYLPMIGLAVIAGWGVPSLLPRTARWKNIAPAAALVMMAVLTMMTSKQTGYWKNSFELFNHAVLVTKNNRLAFTNRGNAHNIQGRYELAIDDCNAALRLDPEYHYAFFIRGFAYARLEKYEQALKDLTRGLALKPDDASGYSNRGNTYSALGQYENALKDYHQAILLKPDYAEAYHNRGNTYIRLQRYQDALDDFDRAIRLSPHLAEIYYRRGNALSEMGRYDRAIHDYNRGIRLKPDNADAYFNRGNAYYKTGQYELALQDYHAGIRLKEDHAEAYYNRGNTHMKLKQHARAIEDYTKAIALDPAYAKAWNNRGVAYDQTGRAALAIDDYRQAIQLKPDYAEAYYNRGNAVSALKQYEQAIRDYSDAIRLKPDYTQAYNNRAHVCRETGNTAAGCRDAKKACDRGNSRRMKDAIDHQECP